MDKTIRAINYGKLLQKYLKANGMSITHASKLLGMSRGTLYERFKDGNFTYHQLLKVKQLMNLFSTETEL